MAKKPTPLAGEATTANYNWVKPTVGSSVDLWGGYINADLDSIDGVVHAIDTRPFGVTVSDTPPANPQVGQEWFDSVSGQLYVWYDDGNSSQWVIAVNAAASLLPASTTVLGGVKVDGTTIQAAPDGTISTTVVPMGDNRIINGDMRIDQRNNGASGAAINGYTIDRWRYDASQAAKGTWNQNTNSPVAPGGFPYGLAFTSSSAFASAATDYFQFDQNIEADMISDFQWGTANAQPVTLSFLAYASKTGTYSGCLGNYAATRNYPFTFSIPAAGTWTKIVITIPGDTTGAWVLAGNAGGATLHFDLGSGSNYRAAANAWTSSGVVGATGSVSVVATNGAYLLVTGVKLEIGSVATPFNRQSLAKSMADCQRYFFKPSNFLEFSAYAPSANALTAYGVREFPVTMRATPTQTGANFSLANANTPTINIICVDNAYWASANTAAGAFQIQIGSDTYSAEL